MRRDRRGEIKFRWRYLGAVWIGRVMVECGQMEGAGVRAEVWVCEWSSWGGSTRAAGLGVRSHRVRAMGW